LIEGWLWLVVPLKVRPSIADFERFATTAASDRGKTGA
jgi:hypothetical protein